MTRGLYKQPGGKLVGVTVRLSHADPDCTDSDYADSDYIDSAHTNAVKTVPYAGPAASSTVIECHIDGDFFLDGDDAGTRNLLHSMECALEQCAARCLSGSMVSERDVTAAVERTMLHHPDVRIVGMGARGIAIAFQRAIDGIDGADGIAGIGGNDVTKVEPRDDLRIRRHTSPMETAETAEIAKNIENAGTAESDENAGTVGTDEIAETGNWAEYARRWHALKPNIVHDDPRKPQEQMDLDVEWAREVAAGTREPTLRFWEWAEPAVVIGRFQSLEDEVNVHTAQDEGFHIVRRCTGGERCSSNQATPSPTRCTRHSTSPTA